MFFVVGFWGMTSFVFCLFLSFCFCQLASSLTSFHASVQRKRQAEVHFQNKNNVKLFPIIIIFCTAIKHYELIYHHLLHADTLVSSIIQVNKVKLNH